MGAQKAILESHTDMQSDQLKSQLLDMIKAERTAFKKVLDAYYAKTDPSQDEYLDLNKKLILSLGRVFKFYEKNNGEDSLFLRSTLKPLREALAQAQEIRKELEGADEADSNDPRNIKIPDDSTLVHITLYQSGGHEIPKWEQQLKSLKSVIQSRPIYQDEAQAARAIRKNMSLSSEGYVSVCVKKDAIIQSNSDTPRCDKHGCELVLLKESTVLTEEAIIMFVLGERHFRYDGSKLIAIDTGRRRFFG
jgi:Dot/Icm secretion system protein IcmQ